MKQVFLGPKMNIFELFCKPVYQYFLKLPAGRHETVDKSGCVGF